MSRDLIFKICLFGDNSVGKTSFIQKAIQKIFNKETKPPTCIDIAIKDLTINSIKVSLQIWIFRSDPQFNFLFPSFTGGTSGGILMYDITNYSSIMNIENWINIFNQSLFKDEKKIPLLLVGGKMDLQEQRIISRKKTKRMAKKLKFIKYFECSSKTGENVETIFKFLSKVIMNSQGYI